MLFGQAPVPKAVLQHVHSEAFQMLSRSESQIPLKKYILSTFDISFLKFAENLEVSYSERGMCLELSIRLGLNN